MIKNIIHRVLYFLAALSLGAALFVVIASGFSGVFIFEAVVSFLPVIFIFSFAFLLAALIPSLWLVAKKVTVPKVNVVIIISWLLLASFCAYRVVSFSFVKPGNARSSLSALLRVGFFNKLMTNGDYTVITDAIGGADPDIMGFAEITPRDFARIDAFKKYPYRYITDCECAFANSENALISKYPIKEVNLEGWGKSSGIFLDVVLDFGGRDIRVLVVHPRSPLTTKFIAYRTNDLKYLAHMVNYDIAMPTIVMGDFNTPPWSKTYADFTADTSGKLVNSAQGQGIHFTWGTWLFQTQIDHIFVSPDIKIGGFSVLGHFGSDHQMILSEIGID